MGLCWLLFVWIRIHKRRAEDRIHGSLCVCGGMDDETVIFLQLGNPVLNVGRRVAVGVLVCNAGDCA